jgi:myo-inositol-1(or 4)-monophosphatase
MSICLGLQGLIIENLSSIIVLKRDYSLKSDNTYVSKGDLLIQDIIAGYIEKLDEEYLMISEEKPLHDFKYDAKANYIIVDPVDGTENYISGLKEWGVSVSVYKKGEHHESMLLMPELNLSLLSGEYVEKFKSRIYGYSSTLKKDDFEKIEEGFEFRVMGCCVYNMYNVINGSYFAFKNFKGAYVWDIIAGLNLALENNLKVTLEGENYNGEFLDPSRKYRFKISHKA